MIPTKISIYFISLNTVVDIDFIVKVLYIRSEDSCDVDLNYIEQR